jgi:hypothetical protein
VLWFRVKWCLNVCISLVFPPQDSRAKEACWRRGDSPNSVESRPARDLEGLADDTPFDDDVSEGAYKIAV